MIPVIAVPIIHSSGAWITPPDIMDSVTGRLIIFVSNKVKLCQFDPMVSVIGNNRW